MVETQHLRSVGAVQPGKERVEKGIILTIIIMCSKQATDVLRDVSMSLIIAEIYLSRVQYNTQ